ncbi:MAG TPA: hypothetical protein VLK84_32380 [Longimicrobium sp.]|nr:hypothetical protein [Longimicrobium sp.]
MPVGERMDFYVLDVLQGLGCFAAFYDKDDNLVASMVSDLGTEGRVSRRKIYPAVDQVAALLRTMKPQPTINYVFLSHSDLDHINLLALLLTRFVPVGTPDAPPEDTLLVLGCKYAGERTNYRKWGVNVLDRLGWYVPQDGEEYIFGSAAPETAFRGVESVTNPWLPVATVQGARVYMLIANAAPSGASIVTSSLKPNPSVPDGYGKNTVSIVSIVDYGASQLVVTGDATGITLGACNTIIAAADVTVDMLIDNFMVTAPHHGSATTTYDMLGIRTGTRTEAELAEENLAQFVRHMGARTLSVSAGLDEGYRHPSARVIQAFWPQLGAFLYQDPVLPEGLHFYTAYFTAGQYRVNVPTLPPGTGTTQAAWPGADNWWSVQTHKNVFSNMYFMALNQGQVNLPPAPGSPAAAVALPTALPPLGAHWIFRVPRGLGQKRSVLRSDNRLTTLAERAEALGVTEAFLSRGAAPLADVPRAVPPGHPAAAPSGPGAVPAPRPAGPSASRPPTSRPAAALRGLRVIP